MNYVLGSTDLETKRLEIQSRIFKQGTLRTLVCAGVKKGMRCLDLGCGTGNTTLLIAGLLGNRGKAVGLDTSQERIKVSKRKLKNKDLHNVRFVVGDVYDTKFEDSSFDLVFSRFLFQHLVEPIRALKEMVRLTRKDGIIALEEFAFGSWLSYANDPNLDKLCTSYLTLNRLDGSDPLVAGKLYKYFLQLNLRPNVDVYTVSVPANNNSYRMIVVLLAEILKEKLLNNGIISRHEFEKMYKGLVKYAENPERGILYTLALRVWSKK